VLGRTLPRLRIPAALILAFLALAFVIGEGSAKEFPLPPEVFDNTRVAAAVDEFLPQLGLSSGQAWGWVVSNNLRALLVASVLGAFTFGVLAVVLLMAPVGLVGYFIGNASLAGQDGTRFLTALVMPHGLLEIPASILAGAAIVHLGLAAVSMPKGGSLGESWLSALADWARVGLGLVLPLVLLAAAVEVFVTPQVAVVLLSGG
jgi:hypothetical protein